MGLGLLRCKPHDAVRRAPVGGTIAMPLMRSRGVPERVALSAGARGCVTPRDAGGMVSRSGAQPVLRLAASLAIASIILRTAF